MAVYYRSRRVGRYKPPFRGRGVEPLPANYQVVLGYMEPNVRYNRLAIVGEGPGREEDETGVPFVGRTGEEVDRFLDTHRFDPNECFYTNITRIYKPGGINPTESDIWDYEQILKDELNEHVPTWIAALGRLATRYFLGDVDMDTVHGVPFLVKLPWLENGRGGVVVVIPVVHPAAGFHNTEAQALIAHDFAQLALTVRGELTPRQPELVDKFPNPDYRDLTDDAMDLQTIGRSLLGGTRLRPVPVAIDTEGLPGNPWGLSYSTTPGTAFVVRKVHKQALFFWYDCLIRGIQEGRIHTILHNSLHDLRVLRDMGCPLPDGSYTDTMVLAYHLVVEPQGLKPLANRHCGMEMMSYDEVIQDAQDEIAVTYYHEIEHLVDSGALQFRQQPTGWTEIRSGFDRHGEWVECAVTNEYTNEPDKIGPFRWIQPYQVRERDKKTSQMRERWKKVQQIDTRVRKALKELRSGKITPAQLRSRWENTDELVVEVVEEILGEMREAGLDDVPLDRAVRYSARDADATIRIYPILKERHTAMGLGGVSEIDHSIIPMVDRMQATGIEADIPYLKGLSVELEREMVAVQQQIKERFGVWINPNSGDQVADLLFTPIEQGGYGLVPTKHTKGTIDKKTGEVKKRRGSTIDKVLEGMRKDHDIIPLILEYRGLNKAKTSFCDVAIRKAVQHPNGRWYVHCLFRITRVSSGRLSATNPNLMAVMGGKLGDRIRKGYIAGEGLRLSEWDLDQIEMRVMADEADAKFLIEMILNGEDIHTGTADRMFHLNLKRPYVKGTIPKEQRDPAKRTGFGVITGIQGPGLVDQMRLQGMIVSEEEATGWIDSWLESVPEVKDYMRKCHQEAAAYGYVRDWTGRIRFLPGIHSPFKHVRAEAGRQSHSHKIQGGAQGIMKIAMAKIWVEVLPYWWNQGVYVQPILQVHDALMFAHDMNDEQLAEFDAQVRAMMFSSAPPGFKVPLDAGWNTADSWGGMEH